MVVAPYVDETHHAFAVEQVGGRVRHTDRDLLWVLETNAQGVDCATFRIDGEVDVLAQAQPVDEAQGLLVRTSAISVNANAERVPTVRPAAGRRAALNKPPPQPTSAQPVNAMK